MATMTPAPPPSHNLPRDPAEEILAYLDAHESAADSLEGIVTWWLPRQRYIEARELIQDSLDRLVARALIVTVRLPDGTVLYRKAQREESP